MSKLRWRPRDLISVILNEALEPIPCYDVRVRRLLYWLIGDVETDPNTEVDSDQVTVSIDQCSTTVTLDERNVVNEANTMRCFR